MEKRKRGRGEVERGRDEEEEEGWRRGGGKVCGGKVCGGEAEGGCVDLLNIDSSDWMESSSSETEGRMSSRTLKTTQQQQPLQH